MKSSSGELAQMVRAPAWLPCSPSRWSIGNVCMINEIQFQSCGINVATSLFASASRKQKAGSEEYFGKIGDWRAYNLCPLNGRTARTQIVATNKTHQPIWNEWPISIFVNSISKEIVLWKSNKLHFLKNNKFLVYKLLYLFAYINK